MSLGKWLANKIIEQDSKIKVIVAIYPGAGSSETYINLDGEDVDVSVSLEVNKSGAGISSNNSNKKKYRVYKINPPIKDLTIPD